MKAWRLTEAQKAFNLKQGARGPSWPWPSAPASAAPILWYWASSGSVTDR